ncbi:hypothetical protein BCR44DRAFT_43154, partial [Catenaria anguillulae PL171]
MHPPLPHLTLELVEHTLATAIRQLPTIVRPDKPAQLAPLVSLLNVIGPFSDGFTIPTKAALMQMWWVDLDFASKLLPLKILDLQLAMRVHRPLDYSDRGFFNGLLACRPDVIEWWYQHWNRNGGPLFFTDVLLKHVAIGFAKDGAGGTEPNNPGVVGLFKLFC